MKICFVSRESLHAFTMPYGEGAELLLFGFNGMEEVSYEKELKGESVFFEEAAKLSKRGKNVVVCGCITNTMGHKRRSALVAEGGKILGVSDMLCAVDAHCSAGAELHIYPTAIGKMGVLVSDDLHYAELGKALVTCGCDFIVCPYQKVAGALQSVLLRADSYRLGVPILFCGEGYSMIADPRGRLEFSSPSSPVQTEYTPPKEYHLLQRRFRGFPS